MKPARHEVHRRASKIPEIQFEEQKLTSFSGLVIFQKLFQNLDLRERLRCCFAHVKSSAIFKYHEIVLVLVVHLLLGYRRLRDIIYYQYDPLVLRLLSLRVMPTVATVSRALATADEACVAKLRALFQQLCLEVLKQLNLRRITLDFDGSVLGTKRAAEGTAVGYNKKKKGARSYYPLFCTIPQTGQVFDFLYRSGNVHDSNGAKEFILNCIAAVSQALPGIQIEIRMDSAFFSDEIVSALEDHKGGRISFTISVPFERFAELKSLIEERERWKRLDKETSFFERKWKPKIWNCHRRFIFIRHKVKIQSKEPIQLDLFIPHEYGYEFKVIITNMKTSASRVLAFHNGRGAQEAIFAELKTQCQMDYIPVTTRVGNQIFLCSAILAHNLGRQLQMLTQPCERGTTAKRAALWIFRQLNTLRRVVIQRAGRITRPHGTITLTISGNESIKETFEEILDALSEAA